VELAGEEVARGVGQRTWLEGAAEVQLVRVDPLEAQLRGDDRGDPCRGARASERVEQRGLLGLNCIESPSGSKPDGLPALVRPTRW
jgi:hypothetical protein